MQIRSGRYHHCIAALWLSISVAHDRKHVVKQQNACRLGRSTSFRGRAVASAFLSATSFSASEYRVRTIDFLVIVGRLVERGRLIHFRRSTKPRRCYTGYMKVEEIAEAVAKLPPDQLARFRSWFLAFEAGRTDHAKELDSTATKLGRLAGRAYAELKKRAKEP
jgi:hypothetical protein